MIINPLKSMVSLSLEHIFFQKQHGVGQIGIFPNRFRDKKYLGWEEAILWHLRLDYEPSQ